MSNLQEFGSTAKALAKNPLGIIALFIVLIYGVAALVVGFSAQLGPDERYPIVLFLVVFPVLVLAVFGWLVSCHYEKLYAPRDFNSDASFLKALQDKNEGRPGLKDLDNQIEEKVNAVLTSGDLLISGNGQPELEEKLRKAAETITSQIRNSSFITVDARPLTKSDSDVFELPASAFSSLNDLTNEIFFLINEHVGPFEYGYTWVIKNPKNGEIIKNARMITGEKAGVPVPDKRSLFEVGISAGMVLEIVPPID